MGIFDKLKSTAQQAVNSAAQSLGNKRETFTFTSLPESLAEMQALPEASLDTPFKTATRLSKRQHSPSSLSAPTQRTGTSGRKCSTGCAVRVR